jgi:hypothetical protein
MDSPDRDELAVLYFPFRQTTLDAPVAHFVGIGQCTATDMAAEVLGLSFHLR